MSPSHVNTAKQRIDYLDVMKGIAIICVVLGHCCGTYSPDAGMGMIVNPWLKIIYSFHMPLFFVAAGIISHPQKEYSAGLWFAALKKDFYSLLLPYFLFCLIYMPFSLMNFGRIAYGTTQMLKASGVPCTQLWFLPCLFIARTLMYGTLFLATKIKREKLFCCGAAVIAFAIGFSLPNLKTGYPFTLNTAFAAWGFMLLGYIMHERLKELDGKSVLIQIGIFAVSAVVLYFGNVYGTPKDFFAGMFIAHFGPIGWFLLNAFAGIVMTRAFSSMIAKIDLNSGFAWIRTSMTWLGRNTIGIFLLHMPLNLLYVMPWMEHQFRIQRGNFGDSCLMTTVILAVSVVGAIIINHVFPALFGKMPSKG